MLRIYCNIFILEVRFSCGKVMVAGAGIKKEGENSKVCTYVCF